MKYISAGTGALMLLVIAPMAAFAAAEGNSESLAAFTIGAAISGFLLTFIPLLIDWAQDS